MKILDKFNIPVLNGMEKAIKDVTNTFENLTRVPKSLIIANDDLLSKATRELTVVKNLELYNIAPVFKIGSLLSDKFRVVENVWKKVLKQLQEYYPYNLKALSKYGWFLEFDSEDYVAGLLENKFDRENLDRVDAELEHFYRTNLNRIIEELCERHPTRHSILEEIYQAYKEGKLYLAVMGLLSQVDGICYDRFNRLFFLKDKKTFLPEVAAELHKKGDEFLDIVMGPITEQCPIYARECDLLTYPTQLTAIKYSTGKILNMEKRETF